MDKEYIDEILLGYPVRQAYSRIAEELDEVYLRRVELWEKGQGIAQGYTFTEETELPDDLLQFASLERFPESIEQIILEDSERSSFGCLERSRTDLVSSGNWRLNLRPGAIISAAQRDNSLTEGSCCCFGYMQSYENTALQMALDPHIAVLEPVFNLVSRRTGMQMVFLGTTGIHAFGDCYFEGGSYHSRMKAHRLVRNFVMQAKGFTTLKEKRNNKAIRGLNRLFADRLVPMTEKTGRKMIPEVNRKIAEDYSNIFLRSFLQGIDIEPEQWVPAKGSDGQDDLSDEKVCIPNCYNDVAYVGMLYDTGIKTIDRPWDAKRICELLADEEKSPIVNVWRSCCNCGKELNYSDRDNRRYVDGSLYGLQDILCTDPGCLERRMRVNATDVSEDGKTVVIGGKMRQIPQVEEGQSELDTSEQVSPTVLEEMIAEEIFSDPYDDDDSYDVEYDDDLAVAV